VNLKGFEFFLADFFDIIVHDIDKVNKRRLMLPWNLDLTLIHELYYKEHEEG